MNQFKLSIIKLSTRANVTNKNIFETTIPVLVNHLNYGNHLGYDSILSILQEARIRWLKSIDKNASEINIQDNIGWLVKKVELDILSEAFHGDLLRVSLFVDEYKKSHFTLQYDVENIDKKNKLCQSKTQQVCYDFESEKISRIPKILMDIFEN